ncbi:MAG: hypothetical protein AB8I69_23215 [Anaerolineae bacterium]
MVSRHTTWKKVQAVIPWLIGLAFVAVEIRRVAGQIAARYPDFYVWADRASRFDLRNLAGWEWVNGLYPLGYPVLLRLGVALGLDVLQAAFVITIAGGFLGLLGVFWLVRRMTNNWTLAILSEVILACTSHYLSYASRDITDTLPAALQICSFALLMGNVQRRRVAFGAGILVGLSYLLRYTASTTIMLSVVFLLGLLLVRRQRALLIAIGLYLLGALIGGLPQLAASALIKGNPIYNVQAHNLWFHLQNSTDYIYDWKTVPLEISVWEVVSADPKLFFSHWWGVLQTSWLTLDAVAVDGPLLVLAPAGFLYAILAHRPLRRRAKAFLAIYSLGSIVLLAFIRFDRRFLITLMPLQIMGGLILLWNTLPVTMRVYRIVVPLRTLVLAALVAISLVTPLRFMTGNPQDRWKIEVSNVLHGAGMESAAQVFSTNLDFHDVADPWRRRFDMAFSLARDFKSYDDLLGFVQERGYRFFIFDRETGLLLYPDMEFLLFAENRPSGLVPIYIQEHHDFAIYRVLGNWPEPQTVEAESQDGISLVGYEVYPSDDVPAGSRRRAGIYLHWETTKPVSQSLKVFVHAVSGDGQLVTQQDGFPVLWTHPTNAWSVGERVVDFHPLLFDDTLGPGPFTILVGLYDPETGQRIDWHDSSGNPLGDHIVLETIEFSY